MVAKLLKRCFCLVLLATVIHGDLAELEKELEDMAANHKNINDLFLPSENGTIKRLEESLVFEGTKLDGGQSVALKFVEIKKRFPADHEFRMYGYLNAINNPTVENYGIPNIHYYQEYKEYMLMVLSLFDGGDLHYLYYKDRFDHRKENLAVNSLLLFRDFVIQSKYMHSCGVRHDDIKPSNIVVRGRRSFLIDFDSSSKMTEYDIRGTKKFFSRKWYSKKRRTAKSDWESFFYTMAFINEIELGWFFARPFPEKDLKEEEKMIGARMKNNTQYLLSQIDKADIASPALKSVFQHFALEALNEQDSNPSYDTMLEFIEHEMGGIFTSPKVYKVFTWLEGSARQAASREFVDINLASINVPADFKTINYVNYPLDFFPKPL